MSIKEQVINSNSPWNPNVSVFNEWLRGKELILEPGLFPEPTIKVMIFLALLEAKKECSYNDMKEIFKLKKVIIGNIPDNTLRTSVLNLGKTLEKNNHAFELISMRGSFKLVPRAYKSPNPKASSSSIIHDPVVLILDAAIKAEKIAFSLIEKAELPQPAVYNLEWSARWWEIYSSKEAEIRVNYEVNAWDKLGIKKRLINNDKKIIGIVGLAPGEGLAEIGLLKKILQENNLEQIHYLAIDSSQRLLRDHIGLLKEKFAYEIENRKLLVAGIVADIFTSLHDTLVKAKSEFKSRGIIKLDSDFLPSSCGVLVTYFGNCLGNNHQDQENELFSLIHSAFRNRLLVVLVGVSVMRSTHDKYIRNWDDFLLQTPRHLLETKKLLKSSRGDNDKQITEFTLSDQSIKYRCPPVQPEKYIVRHEIEGQIYRFYYKLAFDLELANSPLKQIRSLPKGSLILLHSIIKYNMKTLVKGIEKSGLFNAFYDENYHQVVDTPNGKREYAVFTAYVEK